MSPVVWARYSSISWIFQKASRPLRRAKRSSPRSRAFRHEVRRRDGGCVVSGTLLLIRATIWFGGWKLCRLCRWPTVGAPLEGTEV
ncbi:hypothetical protein EJ06DRAFT_531173 [Trichodelitschia bisporula]|uniref:Uncharacterized protein n=1 Tax=Trichodelitschia bisporula TaxID=703511 RepID=A0A6G1HUF3_9PEZI|nr:hypothetical protein EJ06DRAFT_531173 [Trichodelitschia bisporula]